MTDSLTPNEMPGQGPNSFPQAEDDVVKRVKDCQKRADQECSDWYDEAKIDFDFVESKQWVKDDERLMKEEDRIPVTFNRVAATINAICGQEVANRQEVRYLPRRVGPVTAADPMNDAVKWVREQCNAEDEDSHAFRDQTICGMGWSYLRMDYETSPDGRPEILRRSPLLMRWDPSARRKNLADANWIQADWFMQKDAIKAKWPDAELDLVLNTGQKNDHASPIDTTETWKYDKTSTQAKENDELRVVHHVERRTVTKLRAIDPATASLKEYGQDEWDDISKAYDALPDEHKTEPLPEPVKIQRRVYWEAWIVAGTVLQSGLSPCQADFPYQCMTCYPEEDTGYWHGVVRLMRDPQRYANRLMSLMMSILGTGAKGGVLFETGAFANQKKALDDWARWNSSIELTPGTLGAGRVQPKPPVNLPPGASDLMQFAIGSIRDVTGVNIELLGQQNSNETGVVEDMKTKAGLTILASVFDAMRLYRKRQGVILAEYIEKFISDGRLIRILGPQGEQFIPLLRDPQGMEYDVVVDESPTSRDVKDRTWMVLQMLVPMAMQAGMPLPPSLLDYAPLPQSLVMEWKQAIQQKQSQPPQPPPEVQVAQMKIQAESQATQQKIAAETQASQMKLQVEQAAEQARAQADVAIQQHKTETQAMIDHIKNQNQMRLDAMHAQQQQHTQILTAIIGAIGKVEAQRVTAGADDGKDFVSETSYPQQ